ncbi:MAG: HlyD family efflux transporter periplasmic adaptor subunit [Hyphomicrobiaceae bacterium]|nr:HlyD family efflux transporter periplasmic adaptor subunit [Hyphomicrobiaceae bacterium]
MKTMYPEEAEASAHPKLDIRMPVVIGLVVVIAFFGFGVGTAAIAPIDKGVGMPGTIIVESRVKRVQHERGGTVGTIHVREGQWVNEGELLVTLDSRAMVDQTTALRLQADAARRQLELAQSEASTMADLLERKLAARSRVLALQRQVAEIEKEAAGIAARLGMAEREVERAAIRAPVSGRLLTLAVASQGGVIAPGGTVAEIVPDDDRLVIEGRLAPNQMENVRPGMAAKVWLTALSWREQRPLPATLAWVSPDSVEDRRTGAPYFIARVELTNSRSEISKTVALQAGMRSEVLLMTGQRTLLDQLIDPLMRNLNRAFRG